MAEQRPLTDDEVRAALRVAEPDFEIVFNIAGCSLQPHGCNAPVTVSLCRTLAEALVKVERLRKVIPLARRLLKWTGPPWFDKQPPLNHLIRDLQDAINEAVPPSRVATEGKR